MTLHPSHHARTMPDKPAYRMAGSGSAITYSELDCASNQGAQQLRALGLKPQDHIALLAENSLHFFEICWAAQRCGLYYTAISTHLSPDEIALPSIKAFGSIKPHSDTLKCLVLQLLRDPPASGNLPSWRPSCPRPRGCSISL